MKKIFTKLVLGYICVIALLSWLILFFSFNTIREYYVGYLTDDLKNYNCLLQNSVKAEAENPALDSIVKHLGKDVSVRFTVIDYSGKVIADSKYEVSKLENHAGRPEVRLALERSVGRKVRKSATEKITMIYLAQCMQTPHGKIVLRSSLSGTNLDFLIDNLELKIIKIAFVLLALVLVLVLLFSLHITKPIRELVEVAKKVAAGDFSLKVKTTRRDEFRELADSFNYMTEHLNYLFNTVKNEKEKINGLIRTLHEGFVVLDEDGVLTSANAAFSKIVGQDDITGKYFWELINDEKLGEYIRSVRNSDFDGTHELSLNGKIFLVSANHLKVKGLYAVLLHDITNIKELETIKKDFVVNVSHELRTPLTAIKGFVETMEEDASGEDAHYLQIIHRHTDRMINIVSDLLMLSNLEDKNSTLFRESIEVKQYMENILSIFRQQLSEKGIELALQINLQKPTIEADAFRLEQVFINLIDNAIKYTDSGSLTIAISGITDAVKIEISDTGIGIEQEKLARIFERFYVVDKSRSRKLGGTGLGLSIVKHIVLLHDGSINVESTPAKGTKFTIILPQNMA